MNHIHMLLGSPVTLGLPSETDCNSGTKDKGEGCVSSIAFAECRYCIWLKTALVMRAFVELSRAVVGLARLETYCQRCWRSPIDSTQVVQHCV